MHKKQAIATAVSRNARTASAVNAGFLFAGLVVFFLALFAMRPAHADGKLYCDPAIKADQIQQSMKQYSDHTKKIDGSWQDPNSFNDMYCGVSIDAAFDNLMPGGLNSLLNQINSRIRSQMSQMCQISITLEPQSASEKAAKSCTPMIGLDNYLATIQRHDPRFLTAMFSDPNFNYCNMMKMINEWLRRNPGVTIVTASAATGG